jgi:hypothetical protein
LRKTAIILTAQVTLFGKKERKNKRKKERAYKPASAKVEHNKKVVAKVVQDNKDIYTQKKSLSK